MTEYPPSAAAHPLSIIDRAAHPLSPPPSTSASSPLGSSLFRSHFWLRLATIFLGAMAGEEEKLGTALEDLEAYAREVNLQFDLDTMQQIAHRHQ